MIKEMFKIRMWFLGVSIIGFIYSVIASVLGARWHINLNLEIVFCFIFGMVFLILTIIYPIIYKAELMIEKMEDEEDKKDK